jgi:hypothetical protein
MQIRLPRLALFALSIAATNAFAQTTAASPSTDYGNPQAWLCRPPTLTVCNAARCNLALVLTLTLGRRHTSLDVET